MSNAPNSIPPNVEKLLAKLRRRVRVYVWLEGLALAVIWIVVAFWLSLGMDYLPVLAGADEMPRAARVLVLLATSAGLVYILYRWILRRAFVQLANRSLALLLERQYPEFRDALMTAVDLSEEGDSPLELHHSMFEESVAEAVSQTNKVRVSKVFNRSPLLRKLICATLAFGSVVIFAVFAHEAFATWTSRILMLSDTPWPRRASIEVLGFEQTPLKVAEGSDFVVRVRADATRPTPPPELCVIYYELDGGETGRVNMSKDGESREGYQHYRFDGKPFKGMLESVSFDVIGFDARVKDLDIQVVKSPSVTGVEMDCELPEYTGRLPRKQAWRPGTSLPTGSEVRLTVASSKPLREVVLENLDTGESETLQFSEESETSQFDYQLPTLSEPVGLQISLIDTDGISSQQPYRLAIATLADLPPRIDVLMQGIGSAITPQARIPLQGEITDDYGINKSWFDITSEEEQTTRKVEFDLAQRGQVEAVLDLREQATQENNAWRLDTGKSIILAVKSDDLYDLGDTANVGQGDEYSLNVVTSDELLALLEANELNLKRRFEQVISEMKATRDRLLRLQAGLQPNANDASAEPGDQNVSNEQIWSLRVLQVQRANQQGDKSRLELEGVAAAFNNIREQIINNRVDTEERKIRLQTQIIDPLNQIAIEQFPQWQQTLVDLQVQFEANVADQPRTTAAVEEANELLLAMEEVLNKMLELETYNELVDLVRSIIREQSEIADETKDQRKQKARSLLED